MTRATINQHTVIGRLLVAAALTTWGVSAAVPAHAQPTAADPLVLVADKDYAPLSYLEAGEAKGLDVEIARALEGTLGRRVRVVLKEWSEAQRDVFEGRADGLLSASMSEERGRDYLFTDSILLHEFGLFARAGARAAEGLPHRVGVTAGGYPRRFFANDTAVQAVLIANYEEGFARLAEGRIDAVAADIWVGSYAIQRGKLSGLALVGEPFAALPAAIAVRKDRADLVDELNRAIRRLRADGTLQKIQARWRPQEMLFLSRARLQSIIWIAVGVLLLVLLAATSLWIVTLKRQIRVRARAEERGRLLAHALHAANDCVTITDDRDCILYVNEAFLRTYEYEERDVLGQPVTMLRPADTAAADGPPEGTEWESWRGELLNRSRSGRVFPVSLTASIVRDEHGRRIAAVGVARDITQERAAAEALRASEARYRQLVQNANDAVFIVDAEGYCRTMNRAGEEMSGCVSDSDNPRGVHLSRLLVPDQVELAEAQLRRVLQGVPVAPFELTLAHASGARVTVELALRAIHQTDGAVLVQGIARDVTLRKQLEVQVTQSQKMQAIGQLAAGIAHDFNNLMTVVLGNCHEAQALTGSDHPVQALLHDVETAAERAASLTGQLLAFSRRQLLQPRIVRLDEIVSDTHRMLSRLIGEHIELHFDRDPDLWLVSLDPGQLQQILLNLTVNARDAMPDGGRLIVETRNVQLDRAAMPHRRHVPPGDYVMLAVTDNGVGMDEATRARLFEPFFTTKTVGKGTGLGLSTVHGIVEQSDGFIWVYSEPGVGTTFKIYFPRVHDQAADTPVSAPTPADRAAADPVAAGDGQVVLLVEDERAVRDLVSRYLSTQGYVVVTAANGEEAMARCRVLGPPPALLITDVVMPGMNGPSLAETLRQSWPDLQVLYLSGYTDDAILRNGILPAGTHFQQKPFSLDTLIRKVRDILDAGLSAERAS